MAATTRLLSNWPISAILRILIQVSTDSRSQYMICTATVVFYCKYVSYIAAYCINSTVSSVMRHRHL